MGNNIKIAHIGAGYWGKNIIRNLVEMNCLKIICDNNQETLKTCQKQYPKLAYNTDVDHVLADKSIDAVTIATPASTHFSLVRKALQAGLDVFVEKPLALKSEEGEELAELARVQDRILMIGHILRYHPAIEKVKELIENGMLGRVGYCYSNRLNLGKVRKEENILWSFAPHDISVLIYLLDGLPEKVYASGEVILQPRVHDVTLTVMKWRSGVTAHIYVSWLHPFKEQRLVIVGDKAMLVFDDTKHKDKLVLYNSGIDFIKGQPVFRDEDSEIIEFEDKEPLRIEIGHFLSCVENRSQPKTDANEALSVLKVLNSAQESILESSVDLEKGKNSGIFIHPTAVVDSGAESCVENRSQPKTDANEVLSVLKVVNSAQESILESSVDLEKGKNSGIFIHPTAVVDSGAESCVENRSQPKTDANEVLSVLKVVNSAQESILESSVDLEKGKNSGIFIHPTAVVDSGAEIGAETKVWHFSHIMPGAKIGEKCSLGQNVFVASKVQIGNNVKIQNNVSIYEGVIIEDDCFCGPSMVFTNVKNPRSAFPRNTADDYVKTYVKGGATLGANCTIICGVTIGEYAFVAAGAVVNQNVKPNALVAGVPAKQSGWMCECGFRLKKLNGGLVCPECKNKYVLKARNRIVLQ